MSSSAPRRTRRSETAPDVLEAAPGIARELLDKARERLEFLYGEVARTWPGFIARPGQHQMMHAALLTFLNAGPPMDDSARTGNHLALLEAGTGTGKTVAYCLAAIVASELLDKTVIVSTATVALQEQLFHKDLPRLAKVIPDLRFELLKGRGRYVCESRLEGALNDVAQEGLWDDELQGSFTGASWQGRNDPRDAAQAMRWYKKVASSLRSGKWDGDLDSLAQQPDAQNWRRVQASGSACNGGQCEHFRNCAFFKARRRAAAATIQVANHALILATLQTDSALIDPANTLFVFDEAHHLPGIAAEQFAYRARLDASVSLLASLRALAHRHSRGMPASTRPDLTAFGQAITECTDKLGILESWWTRNKLVGAEKPVHRFVEGRIPEELVPECEQLGALVASIATVVENIANALKEPDESRSPTERDEQARVGVELGVYLSRLESLRQLFIAWATHEGVAWAKWLEFAPAIAATGAMPAGDHVDAWLCASPMTAAQLLSRGLWKNVSAAVCTSATLTACGRFDFFDRMSGMNRFPERRALVVASPFDYARQGELRIAPMSSSPKSPEFSQELCRLLPTLLREHPHGQLVLFTSRRQMLACHAALPKDMSALVQMQGERSRTELLAEHGRRVARGQRSILFGLQSFGEGIDLPGRLCEHVVIDKLPFTPPNSPVEEALAEWLIGQGRDPFAEIAVPRAAMKLAQWAGRGVRTVTDHAVITVCDTRLVTMRYGREILAGLPPFPVVRPVPGVPTTTGSG
ncbi:ATP-dependent DNA helicase DinG [Variovorax sp. J22R133]|uniref:ATP-dependent DNA helicase DinG n=1 Tax=Variovorax brevis TaxID=3053503 RepID=UPI002575FD36|nr:ATP-dependent DNA helicase DinG [Variovorax sp. J22R133]MDM0116798.1 ATP-dependent DNA helicase DinG [Variovorax sp. J22R133]